MKITYTLQYKGHDVTFPTISDWSHYNKLCDFVRELRVENHILKATLIEKFKEVFEQELNIGLIIAFLADISCKVEIIECPIEYQLYIERKQYKEILNTLRQLEAEVMDLKRQMIRMN